MTEFDTNDTDVKEELPENADYLTQLLDTLETASATERDKGTRFANNLVNHPCLKAEA